VVSVQNRYNVVDRSSESMAELCEREMLVFLPWAPIQETGASPSVLGAARRHGVSERQVAVAWLLARWPQMLPIPGSGSPELVEQNIAAADIDLGPDEIKAITRATRGWSSPGEARRLWDFNCLSFTGHRENWRIDDSAGILAGTLQHG